MVERVSQVPHWVVKVVLELFAVVVGRCSRMTEYHYWYRDWKPGQCGVEIEIVVDVDVV